MAIAAVFLMIHPSVSIVAHWFPGKTNHLWCYPAELFTFGLLTWILYRLSLPALIARGIFEDRRLGVRQVPVGKFQKRWRWWLPVLRLTFQTFFLAAFCAGVLAWMQSGIFRTWLLNVP